MWGPAASPAPLPAPEPGGREDVQQPGRDGDAGTAAPLPLLRGRPQVLQARDAGNHHQPPGGGRGNPFPSPPPPPPGHQLGAGGARGSPRQPQPLRVPPRCTGWWWWTRATWSRASSLSQTSCKPWFSQRAPSPDVVAGGGLSPSRCPCPPLLPPTPQDLGEGWGGPHSPAASSNNHHRGAPRVGRAPGSPLEPRRAPCAHVGHAGGALGQPPAPPGVLPMGHRAQLGKGCVEPGRDQPPAGWGCSTSGSRTLVNPPPRGFVPFRFNCSVLIVPTRLRPAQGCPRAPHCCVFTCHRLVCGGNPRINTDLAPTRPRCGLCGGHRWRGCPGEGGSAPPWARGNLLSSPRP